MQTLVEVPPSPALVRTQIYPFFDQLNPYFHEISQCLNCAPNRVTHFPYITEMYFEHDRNYLDLLKTCSARREC